jgi:3-hydroxymyristoyl/3-hydroxydecanoyl-(acyl carrier protein) dehydratase
MSPGGASGDDVTLERQVASDHPVFAGHFPGRPVLPGVVLLAEVLEAILAAPALAGALGPMPTMTAAKFLSPVGPGSELAIQLRLDARGLCFDVACHGVPVATGRFARGGAR